jgi:hypothetical protein
MGLEKGLPEAFKKLPGKNVGARCWKLTPHMATQQQPPHSMCQTCSMDAGLWAHSHFSNLHLALGRGFFLGLVKGLPWVLQKGSACNGSHEGCAKKEEWQFSTTEKDTFS